MSKTRPLPKKPILVRNENPLPEPLPVIIETWVDFKPDATEEEKLELIKQARIMACESWIRREAESNPDGDFAKKYFTRG